MSRASPIGDVRAREGGGQRMENPRIPVVDDLQDNLDLIVDLFKAEPWNVRPLRTVVEHSTKCPVETTE